IVQLAVLGGGRMGEALVSGLRDAGWDLASVAIAEVDPERHRYLEEQFPGARVVPSPAWAVADADVIVVAVKPAEAAAVLAASADVLTAEALVVSLAAGVPLPVLEGAPPDRPIPRSMPNTAA